MINNLTRNQKCILTLGLLAVIGIIIFNRSENAPARARTPEEQPRKTIKPKVGKPISLVDNYGGGGGGGGGVTDEGGGNGYGYGNGNGLLDGGHNGRAPGNTTRDPRRGMYGNTDDDDFTKSRTNVPIRDLRNCKTDVNGNCIARPFMLS